LLDRQQDWLNQWPDCLRAVERNHDQQDFPRLTLPTLDRL
jgi:hypothetical protein